VALLPLILWATAAPAAAGSTQASASIRVVAAPLLVAANSLTLGADQSAEMTITNPGYATPWSVAVRAADSTQEFRAGYGASEAGGGQFVVRTDLPQKQGTVTTTLTYGP
jgi:hypothetical protein